jgi:hypothetical protein
MGGEFSEENLRRINGVQLGYSEHLHKRKQVKRKSDKRFSEFLIFSEI